MRENYIYMYTDKKQKRKHFFSWSGVCKYFDVVYLKLNNQFTRECLYREEEFCVIAATSWSKERGREFTALSFYSPQHHLLTGILTDN